MKSAALYLPVTGVKQKQQPFFSGRYGYGYAGRVGGRSAPPESTKAFCDSRSSKKGSASSRFLYPPLPGRMLQLLLAGKEG